jgi:hypothetical protein
MIEKYVSLDLLNKLPKSLINFLWYLWEIHDDPGEAQSLIYLQQGDNGQQITFVASSKVIEQNFGTAVNATVTIKKESEKYFMSRQ